MVCRGLFAALLLASLACASAFDFTEIPDELLRTIKDQDWGGGDLGSSLSAFGGGDDEEFFLLKKLQVWPRLQSEFADALLKLKDELKETEGIKHYQVSRSLADNTLWCICEAWESKEAFLKYVRKEDTKGHQICKYIQKNDIKLLLAPVVPISEAQGSAAKSDGRLGGHITRSLKAADSHFAGSSQGSCNDEDPQCGNVVAMKFFVKPSELEDFKGCLQKFTEKAQDEDGLVMLKFAKTMLDDFTVVGYGEWESRKALESHLQKDYFQEFKQGLLKHDIVAFKSPLKVLTKLDIKE